MYLSGPRQIGKTSVVLEALRRIDKAGGRTVYIDCTGLVDLASFALKVAAATYDAQIRAAGAFARLRETLSGVRPTLMHPDSGLALTFFGAQPPPAERRLEQALKLADELAARDQKRTVVVFDEFPRLSEFGDRVFDQVRAHLQRSVRNTAYVFMGSQAGMLRTLFTLRQNMLYRLASQFDLPAPADAAWIRYIEQRFRSWKRPLGGGEAARMVELTGGHPRDLMEMCRALLDIRLAGPAQSSDVDVALEQAVAALDGVFDEIWKSLAEPAGTRVTAVRIALGAPPLWQGRPRRTVQLSLERLESDGLIRKLSGRGRYEFTEKLFALWLRRHTAIAES